MSDGWIISPGLTGLCQSIYHDEENTSEEEYSKITGYPQFRALWEIVYTSSCIAGYQEDG